MERVVREKEVKIAIWKWYKGLP